MATEALKAGAITDLDLTVPLRHVAGSGAAGEVLMIEDQVTATTAMTSGSTYKMVRLPSNIYLKKLEWWVEATVTTFTADVELWYSDSKNDGTSVTKQNTEVGTDVFAAAVDMHAAAAPADLMYSKFTGDVFNQPLWQGPGALSSDPGGMFDVVLNTTATTSGAPVIHIRATYVVPN